MNETAAHARRSLRCRLGLHARTRAYSYPPRVEGGPRIRKAEASDVCTRCGDTKPVVRRSGPTLACRLGIHNWEFRLAAVQPPRELSAPGSIRPYKLRPAALDTVCSDCGAVHR